MGKSTLEMGLRDSSMAMGSWSLEQMILSSDEKRFSALLAAFLLMIRTFVFL